MSLQVFLQAQLLGSERFLTSPASGSDPFQELLGRCGWLTLLTEVLPRALLADMKLSRMLLGTSGGEQFLVVLTDESIAGANEFLSRAAAGIAQLSAGTLRLVWASTENLGPWPVVRRRIEEELQGKIAAPLGEGLETSAAFDPFERANPEFNADYFVSFGQGL